MLLLDDAHRLDSTSLTMIDRLMAHGALFCIATVVAGQAVPETLTRWWRDERATRIDLGELDQLGVDTLLHVALEGPLDATASAELWAASRGNVLALRELVLGARARELLVQRDGVWCLDGPLGAPTRLREVVEARIGGLDAAARDVLELLALCQPVGLGQLEAAAGLTVLEALERDGLIAIRTDGRRESVRLAHPLHGEVLAGRAAGAAEAFDPVGPGGGGGGVGRTATRGPAAHRHVAVGGDRPGRSRTAAARGPPGALRPRLPPGGHAGPGGARRRAVGRRRAGARRVALQPRLVRGGRGGAGGRHRAGRRATTRWCASPRCAGATCSAAAAARPTPWRWGGRRGESVASTGARDELLTGEAEVLAISGRPLDALALLEQVDVTRAAPARPRCHAACRGVGDDGANGRGGGGERAGVRRPRGARRRARHRLARHAIG